MKEALFIVTVLYAGLIWRALRLAGLTIPFGDRQLFLAQLAEEIQQNGYQPPTSAENQLVFYSANRRSVVVATMAETSVSVTGPVPVRTALKRVFPEAIEKPVGKLRARGVVLAVGVWAVIVALILGVNSLL
jgi:hypothetical protein